MFLLPPIFGVRVFFIMLKKLFLEGKFRPLSLVFVPTINVILNKKLDNRPSDKNEKDFLLIWLNLIMLFF
jgi:hypothetical protein